MCLTVFPFTNLIRKYSSLSTDNNCECDKQLSKIFARFDLYSTMS